MDSSKSSPDFDTGNSSLPAQPLRVLNVARATTDTPIMSAERATIARLFESVVEAFQREHITGDRSQLLTGYITGVADSAALCVRQGFRAHILDKLANDLDSMAATLDQPPQPSEDGET